MDFLKKFTEATKIDSKEETPAPTSTGTGAAAATDEQPPSQADLLASAQVLAQAAKATISKDPSNVDNYKLAGAAADILDAGEHYGKLDTSTGVGSYVDKAEGFLKKYESSNSPPPPKSPEETEPKSTTPAEGSEETEKKASPPPPAEATEETREKTVTPPPATEAPEEVTEEKAIPAPVAESAPSSEIPPAAGDAKSEDKEEPAAESKPEGGYGSVLKAAGDFWKKN